MKIALLQGLPDESERSKRFLCAFWFALASWQAQKHGNAAPHTIDNTKATRATNWPPNSQVQLESLHLSSWRSNRSGGGAVRLCSSASSSSLSSFAHLALVERKRKGRASVSRHSVSFSLAAFFLARERSARKRKRKKFLSCGRHCAFGAVFCQSAEPKNDQPTNNAKAGRFLKPLHFRLARRRPP